MQLGRHRWARRVASMTSLKVVDFLEAAERMQAAGRDIVRLEAGQPAFSTPRPIAEAARRALADEKTRYTPALGIAPLREAIAAFYAQRHGLKVAPERIAVTTGSSAALGLICDLLIEPGDGFLLTDPGYPCNANFVRRAGGEPQWVPVAAAERYQLTAAALAAHWRPNTVGALVASPSNPTGEIIARDQLAALHAATREHGGALVVDEIYHGLIYDESETSILEFTDEAFVVNSFSKYFGMTGWRLGWMVLPEAAIEPINVMAQNFYISPPSIAQYAALAAFQPAVIDELEARRNEFRRRRDFLVPALRELGFDIPFAPAGAFYIYAGIAGLADDCEAFCWDMLERAGVAFTPGTDFGSHLARQRVRFSYTEPLERLELAVSRLRTALAAR
ncbi:MAG: aminotransferase class I/II-fold pyridoxal phosphate-dependent enzyme [Gammaproteobacteria bacterium]|nr:aminotransferase class I/II-fold pyridoxal phosphate-dependent enzyme [Gammaproteobacteria bacterium]